MNTKACFGIMLALSGTIGGQLSAQSAAAVVDKPTELLGVRVADPPSPLDLAFAEFRETGHARTLAPGRPGGFTTFPYGYARPYLRCAALKICQVELQPGEALADDPLPGDRERWDVDRTVSGSTTVVLVKPKECKVSTNLLIITDRRRYVVDLEAPACRDTNSGGDYMTGIRFWYPEDLLHPEVEADTGDDMLVDMRSVNAEYRWKRSRRITWTPLRIFDDGKRTIIQFSPEAHNGEMPVLYAVADDGTRGLVNSVVRPDPEGDYLIADRVLRRGVLVLREGKRERKLKLENLALLRQR